MPMPRRGAVGSSRATLRLPRLLSVGLRLRFARARSRHGARDAPALRRGDRLAGGRRCGMEAFLDRYAVVVMADHGQTRVREAMSLAAVYAGIDGVLPLGSNGQRTSTSSPAAASIRARSRTPRRRRWPPRWRCFERGAPLSPVGTGGARLRSGRRGSLCALRRRLDSRPPDALARSGQPLANPNAGDVSSLRPRATSSPTSAEATTSAAARTGRSLRAIPRCRCSSWISAVRREPRHVAPLVLAHFGVAAPAYARVAPHDPARAARAATLAERGRAACDVIRSGHCAARRQRARPAQQREQPLSSVSSARPGTPSTWSSTRSSSSLRRPLHPRGDRVLLRRGGEQLRLESHLDVPRRTRGLGAQGWRFASSRRCRCSRICCVLHVS